jgi:hypothetical protein
MHWLSGELCDPLTSEVDYDDLEVQFLRAMEAYQRANHRRFPTYREVLHVLLALGYRRVAAPGSPPVFQRQPQGNLPGARLRRVKDE